MIVDLLTRIIIDADDVDVVEWSSGVTCYVPPLCRRAFLLFAFLAALPVPRYSPLFSFPMHIHIV